MPFKSKAQRRKFAALLVEGKISDETFEEWNRGEGEAPGAGWAGERTEGKGETRGEGETEDSSSAKSEVMTSVYSTQDVLIIGHLRNLLVSEGIRCDVWTPFLAAAKGDIPVTDCWSELRVLDDEDVERAREVIGAALAPSTATESPWLCSKCGETIDGQFDVCWQCGSAPTSGKSI